MFSVVIPMYNSSKTITPVVEEIKQEFQRLQLENEYEVILVNDCSPDNVLAVATQLAQEDSKVKVLNLAKNAGQTNAMLAGYKYANGDYIINMDDDLQTPGNEIGKLISTLLDGDYDVVFARYNDQKESKFRLFGSNLNCKMAEIMVGKPKNIRSNSFFIMRRFVRDEIIQYANRYPYVYGIIFAVTSKIANVDITHRSRAIGKSNYTLGKLISIWMNGFLNFSIKPLRMAITAGFIISVISAIVAIILFISRLVNPVADNALGWTSIILTIIFFSGIQLVFIGVLGEYLGRLYISASKLPSYVIRNKINFEEKGQEHEKN